MWQDTHIVWHFTDSLRVYAHNGQIKIYESLNDKNRTLFGILSLLDNTCKPTRSSSNQSLTKHTQTQSLQTRGHAAMTDRVHWIQCIQHAALCDVFLHCFNTYRWASIKMIIRKNHTPVPKKLLVSPAISIENRLPVNKNQDGTLHCVSNKHISVTF